MSDDDAIRFPDAQLVTRDALRRLLAGRSEPSVVGASVGTRLPTSKSDTAPSWPYVVVSTDGTYRNARLKGYATVRVTIWHRDDGLGLDLAHICEGLLLAHSDEHIRSVGSVLGPIPTSDPDTGDPMAFLTLSVRLMPANLNP